MIVNCENCGKEFNKIPCMIKKTKHNFCSQACFNKQRDIDILNRNFFEKINTEEKAYWLGFILADGNINSKSNRIHITLARKDRNHLIKFCNIFGKKLEEYSHKGFPHNNIIKTKKLYSSRCTICSRKLWNNLYEKGIYPNKTFKDNTKIFNHIPRRFLHHFIRGIFDGDGSISKRSKNDKSDIYQFHVVGTKKILNSISRILAENCGIKRIRVRPDHSIYRMYCAGNNQLIAIKKWLYKGARTYLERKKIIFDKININKKRGTSKYKGVSFIFKRKKWQSMIHVDNKHLFLGYFEKEIDAAKAYDAKIIEENLPRYKLNFQ